MDPVSMLVTGAVTVAGSLAKSKATKMEANAQAANVAQQALAMHQDAQAQRMDAEAIRQEAAGQRTAASLLEDQAVASDYNEALNRQNAQQIRLQYAENERRFRVTATKERGAIRAAVGASGVQLTGSALDVLGEAVRTQELDAQTILHEGAVKAIAEENSAGLNRLAAASARKNEQGVLEKAGFIDSKADFSDTQASFLDERANFVAGTAAGIKKAGTLNAIGTFASGVSTLFGRK